jgi:hypothetical protein
MSNKNHIEPVKVETPKRIGKKPTPKIETSLPKAPTTMPSDLYKQREQESKQKQVINNTTMFERLLKSLAGKIIPMLLQWVFPYPVYKRENGDVVKDRKGKPVTDWPMTVLARVLSLITVLYGTVEILGLPLSEWIARVSGALGL